MTYELSSGSEENPSMVWALWREDIYGNQFRMPLELADEEAAIAAQALYTAKGHHQSYSARQMPEDDTTDFIPARS